MAKTRMNQKYREALLKKARELMGQTEEEAAYRTACKNFSKMLHEELLKRFPQDDMVILRRYKVAEVTTRAQLKLRGDHARLGEDRYLSLGGARKKEWVHHFLPEERFHAAIAPLYMPKYRGDAVWADSKEDALYLAFSLVWESWHVWEGAQRAYMEPYEALVASARYLEDVFEVWPEVKELLPDMKKALLPATVRPTHIKRIKADMATREKGA